MAWIRESDARARARGEASARRQKVEALLAEQLQRQAREPLVDVFLAHNLTDRELLLGIVLLVEDQGCRVHVDMSGQQEEVHGFRARLTSASAFIFVLNPKATVPTWVPWAMGFKDGQDGRAAVLPLLPESTPGYRADGVLCAYPYVQSGRGARGDTDLWICESDLRFVTLRGWLGGKAPYYRYGGDPA